MIMKEIVVYLDSDYKTNETIYLSGYFTTQQIKNRLDELFNNWWSYDIINK